MGFSLECGGARVLCEHHSLIVFLQKLAMKEERRNTTEKVLLFDHSAAKFKPIEDTVVFTNHI
jgi:hypothetical protein